MKDYLKANYGIETFEQLICDERLYENQLNLCMPYASFESIIPKEYQQEALFKLIESPDAFAEWVDEYDGCDGREDWRVS
jgi:hypothetical protein